MHHFPTPDPIFKKNASQNNCLSLYETPMINRRSFLSVAGKAGAGIALASLPWLQHCKSNDPAGPSESPVPVNLKFKVYNHTQGLQAEFSENNVLSGTFRAYSVSEIVSRFNIGNVDMNRIAIRAANTVADPSFSNKGSTRFLVTSGQTDYDIFLFNSAGSWLYDWMETTYAWQLRYMLGARQIAVYRRDLGQNGEERVWGGEFLPELNAPGVFDQYNEVLNPPWGGVSYGRIERDPAGTGGKFSYGFADCGPKACMGFLGGREGIAVDPVAVPDIKGQVARGLGAVLEQIVGQSPDIGGQATYLSISPEGLLTQAGKDAIAYVYIKPKG